MISSLLKEIMDAGQYISEVSRASTCIPTCNIMSFMMTDGERMELSCGKMKRSKNEVLKRKVENSKLSGKRRNGHVFLRRSFLSSAVCFIFDLNSSLYISSYSHVCTHRTKDINIPSLQSIVLKIEEL